MKGGSERPGHYPVYGSDGLPSRASLALRGRAPRAVDDLRDTQRTDVAISMVTAMELRFGLAKNPTARVRDVVERFLDTFTVLPIDRGARARGRRRKLLKGAAVG